MSDRTRNEKGQYSTGQETPESEKGVYVKGVWGSVRGVEDSLRGF